MPIVSVVVFVFSVFNRFQIEDPTKPTTGTTRGDDQASATPGYRVAHQQEYHVIRL